MVADSRKRHKIFLTKLRRLRIVEPFSNKSAIAPTEGLFVSSCLSTLQHSMSSPKDPAPNLLDSVRMERLPRHGMPLWGKLSVGAVALAVLGGALYTTNLATKVSRAFATVTNTNGQGLLAQIRGLKAPPDKLLRGEAGDRINVALLGIGGEGHEGAQLTDTIIVMSLQPSTGAAGLLSIPRDLLVNIPGYGFRKINNANAFGELTGGSGAGVQLATSVLEKTLDAAIHYSIRVDFSGFEKLINDISGIEVDVDRSFVDYEYPTANFGYQTIRFEAGRQRFDGATALKYVRSRHGNNGEGSDFARSRRQQKVLLAIKERVFSFDTLLNPARVANALQTLGQHLRMNFEPWELLKLAKMGRELDQEHITTRVLDTTPEGLLVNAEGIDGAYILEPRAKNFSEVQQAFADLLREKPSQERGRVEIHNGTTRAGLASRTATSLEALDITVARVRNAADRSSKQTVIYDLTDGNKPKVLARIREALHAQVATSLPATVSSGNQNLDIGDISSSVANGATLRQFRNNPAYADIDFVIVLGADQVEALQE